MRCRRHGFSMLELLVVGLIGVIVMTALANAWRWFGRSMQDLHIAAELTSRQNTTFAYMTRLMLSIAGATIQTLRELFEDGATSIDASPFDAPSRRASQQLQGAAGDADLVERLQVAPGAAAVLPVLSEVQDKASVRRPVGRFAAARLLLRTDAETAARRMRWTISSRRLGLG